MKTLISTMLLTMSLTSFAGTGGANGPDQNGEAVPIELDREITEGELQSVYKKCYDQSFNVFLKNLTGKREHVCSISVDVSHAARPQTHKTLRATCSFIKDIEIPGLGWVKGRLGSFIFTGGDKITEFGDLGVSLMVRNQSLALSLGAGSDSSFIAPSFEYKAVEVDSSIDIFGRPIPGNMVVRNLKLIGADVEPLTLKNIRNGNMSGLTIDFRDVVSCLQNGLAELN